MRDGGATQQGHGGKGKERAWVGMGISDREWSGEREGRSASPQRQKVETAVCVGAAREIMDRFQNGQHTLEAAGVCARQLIMRRESVVI